MKKAISLILALMMCLSLCACSNIKKAVIGTWEGGEDVITTLEIYQGGSGRYRSTPVKKPEHGTNVGISWKITDGVLTITEPVWVGGFGGYTYDAKNDTLTNLVDTDLVLTRSK